MGACLSTPSTSVWTPPSTSEIRVTRGVKEDLGVMNSAITKERILLEACRDTGTALLRSIRHRADPLDDAVNLASVTQSLNGMLEHMAPMKRTLDNLITRANYEYEQFLTSPVNYPRGSMAAVMTVQATAASLSPNLYRAIHAGKQMRQGADVLYELLQEKYSGDVSSTSSGSRTSF